MGYSNYNRGRGRNDSGYRRDALHDGGSPRRSHQQQPSASSSGASGSLSSRFRQVEQDRRRGGGGNNVNVGMGRPQHQQGGSNKPRMPFTDKPGRAGTTAGAASKGGNKPGKSIGAVRKPRAKGRNNNMMDIDQGPTGRPIGRFPMTTGGAAGGNKRGVRKGRGASAAAGRGGKHGGAAGRGGSRKGGKREPLSKEKLDMDLDSYMMKDAGTAKTTLDADLESYMMGVSDLPTQIGA